MFGIRSKIAPSIYPHCETLTANQYHIFVKPLPAMEFVHTHTHTHTHTVKSVFGGWISGGVEERDVRWWCIGQGHASLDLVELRERGMRWWWL